MCHYIIICHNISSYIIISHDISSYALLYNHNSAYAIIYHFHSLKSQKSQNKQSPTLRTSLSQPKSNKNKHKQRYLQLRLQDMLDRPPVVVVNIFVFFVCLGFKAAKVTFSKYGFGFFGFFGF